MRYCFEIDIDITRYLTAKEIVGSFEVSKSDIVAWENTTYNAKYLICLLEI